MVVAHPELYRKFRNTDNIIRTKKTELASELHSTYPHDYIDVKTHNVIQRTKPWVDIVSPLRFGTMSHMDYERWERDKKFGFTSLQPISIDRILVLCVDFDDKPAQTPIETIYTRFFGDYTNSLKEYYREVSYGKYVPEGDIHGWYRAPNSSNYYSDGQSGFGTYPKSAEKLVEDTLDIAKDDPNIDWTSFDNNGNGYIDNIFVVHSGAEAAYTGDINDIWAHVYVIPNQKVIQDNTAWVYAMTSEYLEKPTDPQIIGGDVHEHGHQLGLPDLYDYTGESNGAGAYSLMGSGSWGDGGRTPTHLDAWSKYILGFADSIDDPVGPCYIDNAEINSDIIKYTTNDPKQYYLVENRQKIQYDSFLPSDGIFIWRVNENQMDSQTYNNDRTCYLVGLVQADGFKDLENAANNGDAGDPYPGDSNNRVFGIDTNPSSELCSGTKQKILIRNISDSSHSMTFDSHIK